MAQHNGKKTWTKTRLKNLVRHRSGAYYVRAYSAGKEVWRSLGTSHFSVAEAKLAEFMKDHRETHREAPTGNARMTFGEALLIHLSALDDDQNIKETTRHYWRQVFRALGKSWPSLEESEVRRITAADCKAWARQFAKEASPTRFNNTLGGMRRVFAVAVSAGIIYRDPSTSLKRTKIRDKQLALPSRANFESIVERIATAGAWCSRDCADLVRGMAYTGIRKGEAAQVEWRDLLFSSGELVVRGDPETGTKNWGVRRVPLIPAAIELFSRMRAERDTEPPMATVFRVREAQRAIDSACRKLGISRLTHHDLRHLFATTCIESGIDVPTVSRWLGHKDGGVLAMKTYGHLRAEHSIAQAKRVSFAAVEPSNVVPMKAGVAT